MGQYHIIVNIDKQEFLHPRDYGDGLKLREFGESQNGTLTALAMLLAACNGRGGGDFPSLSSVGKWAGDRIVILGDYAEITDCPALTECYENWKKGLSAAEKDCDSLYQYVRTTFKAVRLNTEHPELVSKFQVLTGPL